MNESQPTNQGKKEYPVTDEMLRLRKQLQARTDLLNELIKPRFFWQRKYSVKDLIEISREVASVRSSLWLLVYETYPESRGHFLMIDDKSITRSV